MATESIEGPGGGTVRMVVASGRSVATGTALHLPGEEIDIMRDEAGRLLKSGFAYFPGDPHSQGLRVSNEPAAPGVAIAGPRQ